MLPVVVPLSVATACIPFFLYHRRLHLWPVWADVFLLVYCCHTLLTSCNGTGRNLMGSSWMTKQATSLVCFFQSIFLQSVHLYIVAFLPKCGGAVSCHSHICPHDARGTSSIIMIIGIQPLGRSGQRPELSQATGMSLVRCILGKFLGVNSLCFQYNPW